MFFAPLTLEIIWMWCFRLLWSRKKHFTSNFIHNCYWLQSWQNFNKLYLWFVLLFVKFENVFFWFARGSLLAQFYLAPGARVFCFWVHYHLGYIWFPPKWQFVDILVNKGRKWTRLYKKMGNKCFVVKQTFQTPFFARLFGCDVRKIVEKIFITQALLKYLKTFL
jgi:hypothetical protein